MNGSRLHCFVEYGENYLYLTSTTLALHVFFMITVDSV